MWPYWGQGLADAADRLSDRAEGDAWTQWIYGVLFAAVPAALGVCILVARSATLPGRGGALQLHGSAAIAAGLFWLGIAAFAHFQYFWGISRRLGPLSEPGKALSALLISGSIFYVIFYFFVRM